MTSSLNSVVYIQLRPVLLVTCNTGGTKSFSFFLNPYCSVDLDASISKYSFAIQTPACSATTIADSVGHMCDAIQCGQLSPVPLLTLGRLQAILPVLFPRVFML